MVTGRKLHRGAEVRAISRADGLFALYELVDVSQGRRQGRRAGEIEGRDDNQFRGRVFAGWEAGLFFESCRAAPLQRGHRALSGDDLQSRDGRGGKNHVGVRWRLATDRFARRQMAGVCLTARREDRPAGSRFDDARRALAGVADPARRSGRFRGE